MEFVSYDIRTNDFRRAGAASRAIKEHLKRIGAEADAIRRTMIAAYEAEMNVVIHSVGGRLEASLSDTRIDVNVVDKGPGIPDIEMAMKEGFSTAGAEARALGFGAGMGLPNIKRSSDRLRVTSRPGEGTRVSFSVYLRPELTSAAPHISLYASADRCRDCRACISACPTQAIRVRDGRPMVLEHLCIDCAQCIAVCTTGALTIGNVLPALSDVLKPADTALVLPQAVLAGFGADYSPVQALAAADALGFAAATTVDRFEKVLREAALEVADRPAGEDAAATDDGAAGADGADGTAGSTPASAATLPLIIPVCPAIVNLVELKFPSLVSALAPFDSPWEAVEAAAAGRSLACVVSCPSQRSVLAWAEGVAPEPGRETASIECLLPEALRGPVMEQLTAAPAGAGATPVGASGAVATPAATQIAIESATAGDSLLVVGGVRHVIAVLEEMENGLLGDVSAIEAYACEGGCFGSPLLFEDHHVARRRWLRGRAAIDAAATSSAARGVAPSPAGARGGAQARRRPYAARPGIRLDADMGKAIEKLGRLQTFTRSLPGRDCGACGAPTCAALAEDIVMERAAITLCPYLAPEKEDAES